jgi:nanoRNase/pAp phosphatase (c-di-AMP/oligoRNAs hydrolase)
MFRKNLSDLHLRRSTRGHHDPRPLHQGVNGPFFGDGPGVRVSLRSKGAANAAMVAEHFGGGGHVHASGFTATGPYDRLIVEIPRIVEDLLRADPAAERPS